MTKGLLTQVSRLACVWIERKQAETGVRVGLQDQIAVLIDVPDDGRVGPVIRSSPGLVFCIDRAVCPIAQLGDKVETTLGRDGHIHRMHRRREGGKQHPAAKAAGTDLLLNLHVNLVADPREYMDQSVMVEATDDLFEAGQPFGDVLPAAPVLGQKRPVVGLKVQIRHSVRINTGKKNAAIRILRGGQADKRTGQLLPVRPDLRWWYFDGYCHLDRSFGSGWYNFDGFLNHGVGVLELPPDGIVRF